MSLLQIAKEAYRSLKQLTPCYSELIDNSSVWTQEIKARARRDFNYTYSKDEQVRLFPSINAAQNHELYIRRKICGTI